MIVFVAHRARRLRRTRSRCCARGCERPWDRRGVRLDLRVSSGSSAHVIGPSISRLLFLKNYPCASHAARNAALARLERRRPGEGRPDGSGCLLVCRKPVTGSARPRLLDLLGSAQKMTSKA